MRICIYTSSECKKHNESDTRAEIRHISVEIVRGVGQGDYCNSIV